MSVIWKIWNQFKSPVMRERIKAPVILDQSLLICLLSLLMFGLVMVTSASIFDSAYELNNPYFYMEHQIVFVFLGLIILSVILFIPTDNYERIGIWWLVLAFCLLVAVLIPGIGRVVNGSRRWIPFGLINIQVSEIVKLCAIMYFSSYLVRFGDYAKQAFLGVIKPIMLLGVLAVLLLLEPDFGASVVMFTAVFGIMFMAGVRLRWFVFFISIAAILATVLVIHSPYRFARLTGFMDPWADMYGSGYQLTQALIGFGRGGWFGVGLGASIQKLFYLPEAHTDFILSIIAEELGSVGVLILLCVYALMVWRGLRIARMAFVWQCEFQSYIAYGITFWLAFQVLVNTGVNLGVLPTKGLTLPFISYGGSSLMLMCMAVGILLRIDFETKVRINLEKPKYMKV